MTWTKRSAAPEAAIRRSQTARIIVRFRKLESAEIPMSASMSEAASLSKLQ
jgi:hypothetical protein